MLLNTNQERRRDSSARSAASTSRRRQAAAHARPASIVGSRSRATLLALALAGVLAVGGTLAWLTAQTDEVENAFEPGKVTTTIVEDPDGNAKKDVKIRNTGNVDAYIRAAVVVTWQNEDGEVYGKSQPVAGTDYKIAFNKDDQTDGKWVEGDDGFWYWTGRVAPAVESDEDSGLTGVLITSCTYDKEKAPAEGYHLCVEVIGSGVQADGVTTVDGKEVPAVEAAWSSSAVSVKVGADGKLAVTKKTA